MAVGIEARIFTGKQPSRPAQALGETSPFRILLLGNFAGTRLEPDHFAARRLLRVDADTFDAAFTQLAPSLTLELSEPPAEPIDVSFSSLEDFEPDALFSRLSLFARMRELRARLEDATTFEQAAAELRATTRASQAESAAPEGEAAMLERLLGRPNGGGRATQPPSPATPVEKAVGRLLQGLVAPYIVPATAHLQRPFIDALDSAISASMRALLRHPKWSSLEGNWRALDRFVRQVEMEDAVVLEVLDVDADELLADFTRARGDIDASTLSELLASRRAREGGEEFWTLIVGLFEFGSSAAELALLAALGALAANCGAVFVGSAAPELLNLSAAPRDMAAAAVESEAAIRWRALRESWVARHVALVWPRVLSRLPFGARTEPVERFAFEELGDGFRHDRLAWRCAALDCAALLAASYTESEWEMTADQHLDIEDLPAFIDRSESPPRMQAAAEIYLSEREARMAQAQGVVPLVSHRSLPQVRLTGWQSIASDGAPLAARWQRSG